MMSAPSSAKVAADSRIDSTRAARVAGSSRRLALEGVPERLDHQGHLVPRAVGDQAAHQLVLRGGDLLALAAVEDDQLRRVGAEPGQGLDVPAVAEHGLGAEAGGGVGEQLEAADHPDVRRDGGREHALAEGPHRVDEHGGRLGRHPGDQLQLGLHDLGGADVGDVGVEQGEVVLGVVDRGHPDEAVGVADALQTAQLAQRGDPGSEGGDVASGRPALRTEKSCESSKIVGAEG